MILQYFSLRAVKKDAMSAISRETSMQIVKKMMRNILPFSIALLYYNSEIAVGSFWGGLLFLLAYEGQA
jgi:ABC-type anion transport system duplicated permease subunit